MTTRKAMNAVALAVRTCPPNLMTTLAALVDNADENHQCRLPQVDIAEVTGDCERTVRRKLHRLQKLGIIDIQLQYDSDGCRKPSLTTIVMPVEAYRQTMAVALGDEAP